MTYMLSAEKFKAKLTQQKYIPFKNSYFLHDLTFIKIVCLSKI